MTALYNVAYYYDNSMNFDDDDFKVIGKLLASCYSTSYREGIKLPTNKDSVAVFLVATHI